jgi:Cutinase
VRTTRSPTWRAALLSVVTFLSVGTVVFGASSPAYADPGCNSGGAYLLWVRGSGQDFDDVESQRFKEHARYALNAAGVSAPEWAWAELGNLDGDYLLESEAPQNEYPAVAAPWNAAPWIYGPSVEKGTNELIAHLNDRYAGNGRTNNGACHTEVAVIGGYSQGADVVGWALERTGYGSLSAEARRHIGYTALYGDPKNDYGCNVDRWWQRGTNANGCNHDGILGARNPYAPAEFRGRLGSWCDTYDGICTSGSSGGGIGNHTTIYREWWIWQSAAEIAKAANNRLGLLNPPQGGGVGTATYLGSDTLNVNQVMYRNQYLMSPDGVFVLIFQSDGNLVLFGHRYQPLWASNTAGQPGNHVVLQPDGNLVMYSAGGQPVWYNGMNGTAGTRVVVQADGNLVEYNAAGQAAWHTNTGRAVPTLSYQGSDHLNPGQALWQNQYLRSSNGTRFLQLQADGNLVVYGPGYHLLWHTNTSGAAQAVMQPDGNIVLYNAGGGAVWSNGGNGNNNAFVVIQPDGNLTEYAAAGYPMWWSGTAGMI